MSITYSLTKLSNNSFIELILFGDGTSDTITVPLDLLPIDLALTKRENKPVRVTGTVTVPSSVVALSSDQLSVTITFSAPPSLNSGVGIDLELFYEGL